jgi:hypothetical protein
VWFRTGAALRASKSPLTKKLVQVLKAARKLRELLDQPDVWRKLGPRYPLTFQAPSEILKELITAADTALSPPTPEPAWAQKAAKRMRVELQIDERSAFDWLVGIHLPKTFSQHFGTEATLRRSDGDPDTPYVRFAEATLTALGIDRNGKPYARESIVKAVTSARGGRTRRKPDGQA